MDNQWLFPSSALRVTPSNCPLDRELYDRARGIEFLFRLGSSLNLPTPAMLTAATWFHRFYMRYALEDFHRQDVAAACIFLATKIEDCGRKLRDVARVCHAKIHNIDVSQIPADSKEVDQRQTTILLTEEVLLEALCFDFIVESPHAELVELFELFSTDRLIQEFAWSLAHDTYRTPVCILYPPKIIAAACYVLAQRIYDGPNSPSLDARISSSAPSASLPTPPTHKPPSPDATRYVVDYYAFNDAQLGLVSEALSIILEFYSSQDLSTHSHLETIIAVPPPSLVPRPGIYTPSMVPFSDNGIVAHMSGAPLDRTPNSTHGGQTPTKGPITGSPSIAIHT